MTHRKQKKNVSFIDRKSFDTHKLSWLSRLCENKNSRGAIKSFDCLISPVEFKINRNYL